MKMLKGTGDSLKVTWGVGWNPVQDAVVFEVTLNFNMKRRGIYTGPNLEKDDVPQALPLVLTRRIVLGQVMMIFDPLGFVCPFTLLGKCTCEKNVLRGLAGMISWTPLQVGPFLLLFVLSWVPQFGPLLMTLNSLGQPWLLIFSDGSELAYGFAAYIRWQLDKGDYCCRLVTAKCRIAPEEERSLRKREGSTLKECCTL